jgi:nucleoside phosphorylase
MVSVGIAHACEANGVPYVIIRVLSDIADESVSVDFAAFVNSYKDPVTPQIALKLVDRFVASSP